MGKIEGAIGGAVFVLALVAGCASDEQGDLVEGTMTGRNFGWLPDEHATALAHIADVIRNDDGRDALAAEFGAFPYRVEEDIAPWPPSCGP